MSFTRLLLIRHGETSWNSEERYCGSSDIPLSENGRLAAKKLADKLKGLNMPVAAVYTSSLQRAIHTAEPFAAEFGLTLQSFSQQNELDYGEWEGKTRLQLESEYASLYWDWVQRPDILCPPGGESGSRVLERAQPLVNDLIAQYVDRTVVIVAHKSVNRILLCSWMGIPLNKFRTIIDQSAACLSQIHFNQSKQSDCSIVFLNDTCHLRS